MNMLYVTCTCHCLCSGAPPKSTVTSASDLTTPKVYGLSLLCSLLYSLTFVADLAVKGLLHVTGDRIYGYTIVMDTVAFLSWLSCLPLIYQDKGSVTKGRSFSWSLVLFWLVNSLWLGLELVSYNSLSWWWHLKTRADISDLVLWLTRLLLATVLLSGVLYSLCCGRGRRGRYSLLLNVDPGDKTMVSTYGSITASTTASNESKGSSGGVLTERQKREGQFVTTKTNSAFANIVAKAKVLFPYVWPKGDFIVGAWLVVWGVVVCGCGSGV